MSEFVPNLGFVEEMALSPFARELVDAVGEKAKAEAQRTAPVGDSSDPRYRYPLRAGGKVRPQPGAYKKSINTRTFIGGGPLGRSWVCRLASRNMAARWIEYGTVKVPPQRTLHRSVDYALTGGTLT